MRSQSNTTLWGTFFFALLGLVWCGYLSFPTANPAPCVSSGCILFRDFRIAGVSLWWVGGAYFFLLAILSIRGNRYAARTLAMLGLFVDVLLLIIMLFTVPCFDCLVAGAIIGLCYYTTLRPAPDSWFVGKEVTPSVLLPVWFGLFLGNGVLAVNEQIPLHALGNTRTSEIRVFFSPSCKACREAVSALGNAAALYPVMESERDFDAILRFSALLKADIPAHEAMLRSMNENEPVPLLALHEWGILRLQLLRNRAHLLRQGFRAVPLIQINGWPGEQPSSQRPAIPLAHEIPVSASPPVPHEEQGLAVPELPRLDFLADPDALEQCAGDRQRNRDGSCD